jgi:hypothetical protein
LTNNGGHDAIIAQSAAGTAIGIWSISGLQLGAIFPGNTVKLDGDHADIQNPKAGQSYGFDVVVAIGTIADVASALHQDWFLSDMATQTELSMYGSPPSTVELNLLTNQFLPPQVANAKAVGLNPTVYGCEALGLTLAFGNESGSHSFEQNFGLHNLDDASFAAVAASIIFGANVTAGTPTAIKGWVSNWESFYTSHGIPGIPNPTIDQVDTAARGAAWGDAVGVALDNHLGPLAVHLIGVAA